MSNEHPIMLDLEPGTYYWCSCGKTQNQPFCDGSHEGTSFLPMEFIIAEKKQYALCNCQRTQDAPHCDGSHENI
jgi:CDGSH-type Zn-finger protein